MITEETHSWFKYKKGNRLAIARDGNAQPVGSIWRMTYVAKGGTPRSIYVLRITPLDHRFFEEESKAEGWRMLRNIEATKGRRRRRY